jgi:hypothetical protein
MAMRKLFVLLVAALMALASPAAAEAPRLQVQQATSQFDKYQEGQALVKEAGLKKRLLAANVKSMMLKHQIDKMQAQPHTENAQETPVGEMPAGAARKLLGRRGAPATPVVSLPVGSPLNVPAGMVAQGTSNGVILRQETIPEKKARERLTKAQMNKIQAAERNWEKFKTHLIATEQQAERLYEAAQQAKAEAGMLEGPPADPAAMPGAVAGSVASPGMLADAGAAGGR